MTGQWGNEARPLPLALCIVTEQGPNVDHPSQSKATSFGETTRRCSAVIGQRRTLPALKGPLGAGC